METEVDDYYIDPCDDEDCSNGDENSGWEKPLKIPDSETFVTVAKDKSSDSRHFDDVIVYTNETTTNVNNDRMPTMPHIQSTFGWPNRRPEGEQESPVSSSEWNPLGKPDSSFDLPSVHHQAPSTGNDVVDSAFSSQQFGTNMGLIGGIVAGIFILVGVLVYAVCR